MKFTHEDVRVRVRESERGKRKSTYALRRKKQRSEEEERRMREKENVGEEVLLVAFPRRAAVLLFEVRAA